MPAIAKTQEDLELERALEMSIQEAQKKPVQPVVQKPAINQTINQKSIIDDYVSYPDLEDYKPYSEIYNANDIQKWL